MTYGVEISFNGMPLDEPVDNKDLAISSPLPPRAALSRLQLHSAAQA